MVIWFKFRMRKYRGDDQEDALHFNNSLNPITGDKIRIFTYLIGKDLKNADPLKTMACTRRGYFSHIASPADVKENVMQYYHVMNRQLAKTSSTAAQPRWSQESFFVRVTCLVTVGQTIYLY